MSYRVSLPMRRAALPHTVSRVGFEEMQKTRTMWRISHLTNWM